MSPSSNRVYFPVESLTGLGHFTRTGKLARELIASDYQVTVASSTFVDPKRFFPGAQHCTIPPYIMDGLDGTGVQLFNDGRIKSIPHFDAIKWQNERAIAHERYVRLANPDVLITEYWPFDRPALNHEMQAVLTASQTINPQILNCVSVRDVLNVTDKFVGEEATYINSEEQFEKREQYALDTINRNFQAILVHGDSDFVPFKETFPRADDINAEIIYTGYVLDDLPSRAKFVDDSQRPILVSCGSGVDGDEMVYAFLTAWQKLLRRSPRDPQAELLTRHPLAIVTGPRFNDIHYNHVLEWAHKLRNEFGQKITVEKYRKDYTSQLANCAFSVSYAGYNTTLEILATNVPALLIPKYIFMDGRIRLTTEQYYRLMRLQQSGYLSYTHPKDVQNADKFADILTHEFIAQTTNEKRPQKLNFSGASNTVVAINQLVEAHRRPQRLHYPAAKLEENAFTK